MKTKKRADILLVEKGMVSSRQKAQALIMAGEVYTTNRKILKSGEQLDENTPIFIKEQLKFVGRGGYKLEEALSYFNITVKGKIALDAGASTGGFTDVLLQNGAKLVYAVDVGENLLDWKLKNDNRVIVKDKTNIRHITPDFFDKQPEIAVADLSFISLTKVLEPIYNVLTGEKEIVTLVKPQFEVGRENVGKGGIIKDEALQIGAVNKIINFSQELGLKVIGWTKSPIKGQKGNQEYLLYMKFSNI